jgi:2-oxoglutarate dehydrogenase E2 component (dihydrolipoamide succinyltransferase)
MTTKIVVPALGESVTEATIAKWFKSVGETVAVDEPLVELETDKVTVEVNAPAAGTLSEIAAEEGSEVEVGGLLGTITDGAASAPSPAQTVAKKSEPAQPPSAAPEAEMPLSPAVRKLVDENELDPASIAASGKDGRLTKGDVLAYLEKRGEKEAAPTAPAADVEARAQKASPGTPAETGARSARPPAGPREAGPREERVRMTRLRKMVATRLKEAQNVAAMLTTFNEVDMGAANALRQQYRDAFEKKHGVRFGVMSIFIKACTVALREFPAVNAEIDGDDIVYKNHYDIAIAVSSPNGLVVPVLRNADTLSFAEIEAKIADFAGRARQGGLTMEEMQGGTFTLTNGGVFGSLMSTPILNPPQSGILGMHKIQQRPMVMPDGSIEARPMMYVALSYDHRIIDGREAVSFLVRVKECVEDPQRILLNT